MKENSKISIYIPIWENDPHLSPNPYVATLVDGVMSINPNVNFAFDKNLLWSDDAFSFNIIHFMWPHLFAPEKTSSEFKQRIQFLKEKGINIISTCHNIGPHSESSAEQEFYDIVYSQSSTIIHLGENSKDLLYKQFPKANHIIIPHHIYDSLYKEFPSSSESFSHLHIPRFWKYYILCIGAFRNQEERQLICKLSRNLLKNRVAVIAPSLNGKPKLSLTKNAIIARIKWFVKRVAYPNLIASGTYVSDFDIPFYFGICDALVIQRIRTTNSGNLPLAFYFGKAVIGPDVGNVGAILKATNNPVFDPLDDESVYHATLQALNNLTIGKQNHNIAISQWNVDKIALKIYEVYKSLCASV